MAARVSNGFDGPRAGLAIALLGGGLATILILGALSLWGGEPRPEVDGGAERVSENPGPAEAPLMPTNSSERAAVVADGDAGERSAHSSGSTARREPVDVFVTDPLGAPLLDRASSPLAPGVLFWLRVHLIEGEAAPARVPAEARVVGPRGGRVRRAEGWYSSIDPVTDPTWCILALGEHVVAAEPVAEDTRAIRLVVDPVELTAGLCEVRGSVAGLVGAARYVAARPMGGMGGPSAPVLATCDDAGSSGEGFVLADLPPGPCRLEVQLSAGQMVRAIRSAAGRSERVTLGARVAHRGQWDIRLRALALAAAPFLSMDLRLKPGQIIDLGTLHAPASGVLVLDLRGPGNAALEAHRADVRVLSRGQSSAAEPTKWSFGSQLAIHPLPTEPVELIIGIGEQAALVSLQPRSVTDGAAAAEAGGDPFPAEVVELSRVAVVQLAESGGERAQLVTAAGSTVRSDPRWQGGTYRGHSIGEGTILVPGGEYRLGHGGTFVPVSVRGGTAILTDSRDPLHVLAVEALGDARRKKGAAR